MKKKPGELGFTRSMRSRADIASAANVAILQSRRSDKPAQLSADSSGQAIVDFLSWYAKGYEVSDYNLANLWHDLKTELRAEDVLT